MAYASLPGKKSYAATLIGNFFLDDIQNGVDIIDADAATKHVHCENHKYAQPGSPLYTKASKQILHEIGMGNYEVVSEPPDIISLLGVIEKPDRRVRLIHDCSMPHGRAINEMITALRISIKNLLE